MTRYATSVTYYDQDFLLNTRLLDISESEEAAQAVAEAHRTLFNAEVPSMKTFHAADLAGAVYDIYPLDERPESNLPVLVYVGFVKTNLDSVIIKSYNRYSVRRIANDYTAAFFNPHTGNDDFETLLPGEIPSPDAVREAIARPDDVITTGLKAQVPELDEHRPVTVILLSRDLTALKRALEAAPEVDITRKR